MECAAAPPAPPAPAGAPVHACARLAGLVSPGEAARRLAGRPAGERRARLVALLSADAAGRAAPVTLRLRAAGARDVRLIWSAGVVCADAPRAAWDEIARQEGVVAVFDDPPREESELLDSAAGPNPAVPPEAPLVAMRVPEAWQRGYTGRGTVVALMDTGVDRNHPDLAGQIWVNPGEIAGNGLDDDGNGYADDVHGYDFADRDPDPSDSAGHGTNAAGLIVGDGSAGKQTGAAPGATLMVLRRGTTQATLWEASQYAIENGAHVLSQSVSWKWSFLPRPDYSTWRRQAETELAAGLIHTNSGGNTGEQLGTEPIPYNVAAPANCPPPWLAPEQVPAGGVSSVLGIGNVDARTHAIAPSSPYGPAEWTDIAARRDASYPWPMPPAHQDYPAWSGQPGLLKPDLVAPGENSTSTALGGGYTTFGGTSAATPRVAGILALLREAAPRATPAELARALLVSAQDLGPAGRDARHGAGMPQADAAIDAAGPPLFVAAQEVSDDGPPRGDGDGAGDAGEIVRLALTIENASVDALSGVDLVLRGGADAVVRDGYVRLASIAAQGAAVAEFTVEFPAGSCARAAELALEMRQGGRTRVEPLFVTIGTETRQALFADDAEQDRGWSVAGSATSGQWVRQAPVGTTKNGAPMNPASDASPAPGTLAWVTGNGPTTPDAADVDGGATTLTAPPRDARSFARVELRYARWFASNDAASEDRLLVEATGDGTAWRPIEEITAPAPAWRPRTIVLSDLLAPGARTALRVTVEDVGSDDTVEGGLDEVLLEGIAIACSEYAPPAGPTPDEVGATLRLAPAAGGHLLLTWDPPSAAGGVDPPRGYRVRRSASASGGFAEIGQPLAAEFTEVDGVTGPAPGAAAFYLVESLRP
jgi:subtilisin family serine protease